MKKIKDYARRTGGKIKGYASKKYNSAKSYAKNYKTDLSTAYGVGYRRGWDDAYTIPRRLGSSITSAVGYNRGFVNRRKSDKYTSRYNKR